MLRVQAFQLYNYRTIVERIIEGGKISIFWLLYIGPATFRLSSLVLLQRLSTKAQDIIIVI